MLIVSDHLLNTVDARVEDIAVHGKAVRRLLVVRGHSTAEAIKIDLLISVVELQNVAHLVDDLQILVPGLVEIVKGVGLPRVAI